MKEFSAGQPRKGQTIATQTPMQEQLLNLTNYSSPFILNSSSQPERKSVGSSINNEKFEEKLLVHAIQKYPEFQQQKGLRKAQGQQKVKSRSFRARIRPKKAKKQLIKPSFMQKMRQGMGIRYVRFYENQQGKNRDAGMKPKYPEDGVETPAAPEYRPYVHNPPVQTVHNHIPEPYSQSTFYSGLAVQQSSRSSLGVSARAHSYSLQKSYNDFLEQTQHEDENLADQGFWDKFSMVIGRIKEPKNNDLMTDRAHLQLEAEKISAAAAKPPIPRFEREFQEWVSRINDDSVC
jgi:hypothetical protein